jgi:tetratricopeptide (TPR) repeat protein
VGLAFLTWALSTTVSSPLRAEDGPATLIAEAERLTGQARELANDGKLDGAIAALERALQLQEEQIVPRLPEPMRPLFRLELTEDKLFLAGLFAKSGNFARAVELVEAEVRFHESFSGADKYADLVAGWKAELPRLKANTLLAEVKRGIDLYQQDRNSEALLVLQRVLPEVDRSSGIAPQEVVSVNVIAARIMKGSLLYAEAEARLLRALDVAEKEWDKDAPQLIGILSDLGQLALQRGIHERGAKYLVRAHAIAQAHRAESLPGTVKDLGLLLARRDDHAQAIQVLNKAIALYSARSGTEAVLGGLAARLYLASVQDDAGQFADAEASYQ